MITRQLAADVENFTNVYIYNYSFPKNIFDYVKDQLSDDSDFSIDLDSATDVDTLWGYIRPAFDSSYELFTTELFKIFPVLVDSKWNGKLQYFIQLWNEKVAPELEGYRMNSIEITIAESEEGGSYFFNLYSIHTPLTFKIEKGDIVLYPTNSDTDIEVSSSSDYG